MNQRILRVALFFVASAWCVSACSSATTVNDGGSDAVADSPRTDSTVGDGTDVNEAGVSCGSAVCTGSQMCCAATQQCYDPTCLACCTPRPDAGPGDVPTPDTGTDSGASDAVADSGGGPCTGVGTCPTGLTCCSGACINLANDPRNCGSCGQSCADPTPMCAGGTCAAQTCSPPCGPGFECCFVNGPGPVGGPACYAGTTCPVGCPLCV